MPDLHSVLDQLIQFVGEPVSATFRCWVAIARKTGLSHEDLLVSRTLTDRAAMFSAGKRPPRPAVEDFCERARTVLAV